MDLKKIEQSMKDDMDMLKYTPDTIQVSQKTLKAFDVFEGKEFGDLLTTKYGDLEIKLNDGIKQLDNFYLTDDRARLNQ